jgi:hypothetical protein
MKTDLKKRFTAKIVVLGVAVIAIAAVGVAVAEVADNGPAVEVDQAASAGSVSKAGDLPVFRVAGAGKVPAQSKAALVGVAQGADPGSLLADVDFGTAVRTPIAGRTDFVWVAKSGDDGICVFVPANGSFSSACGTGADVEKTGLLGVSRGAKPSETIAYQVVPEGGPPAIATAKQGSSRQLSSQSGVTAEVVSETDKISNGVVTYDLAKMSGRE